MFWIFQQRGVYFLEIPTALSTEEGPVIVYLLNEKGNWSEASRLVTESTPKGIMKISPSRVLKLRIWICG
jgi:hypothetical protein